MNRTEAREYITKNPQHYLTPDNSGKGYICPVCSSGTGKNGTGITSKDGVHFTCWTGCYTHSDIIDIIGLENSITDYNQKLEWACSFYAIDYSTLAPDQELDRVAHEFDYISQNGADPGQNSIDPAPADPVEDYTAFYRECAKHRGESDYLLRRGISERVQASFSIGYCPAWKSPKAGPSIKPTPRIIIPTSSGSYIARDTRPNLSEKEKQFSKMKAGKLHIFNLKALANMSAPAFIVEGEIDALSIIEAGHSAIALGSTTMYRQLVAYLKANPPAQPLLIALDNDEAGRKTADQLRSALKEIGIEAISVDITGSCKDPNEALVADRDAFRAMLDAAIAGILQDKETQKEEYLKNSSAYHLKDFINGISASVNTPYTPTGFPELDKVLDGGLYEGFYIVGAISSLGKTTLVLQIADQIARAGRDVLIFSLEMARNELMAKSISRSTIELALKNNGPVGYAKTTRGITVGKYYDSYLEAERELINNAVEDYRTYAHRVFIKEGIGNIGANQIREAVAQHIEITGNTPVVIIDYLQILAPFDDKNRTDKQNTDLSVTALKRISRDFKLPLIGISSFNRDNYNAPVNMTAFKESGSIEYSSDLLIGLQLSGVGAKDFNVDEAKKKDPRRIEMKILKNRNGKTGDTITYDYYPRFNYFQEVPVTALEFDDTIQ